MTGRRKSPLEINVTEAHMCSVNLRLQILGQVPFFSRVVPRGLEQINSLFHEQGYAPDETIYFAGDPVKHLFVVADGTSQTDAPFAFRERCAARHIDPGRVLWLIFRPG